MRFLKISVPILGMLLPNLGTTQTQRLLWSPPFNGLNLTLDKFSIGDKEFVLFNNGMVNNNGEVYKRGGINNLNAFKIDSNTSSSNGPVNQLFRFRKSNGSSKLLANYLGGSSSASQFSLWYWLNDFNRFAHTYSTGPDTMSQVMYNAGTVSCTTTTTRIWGSGTNFFLKAGSQAVIKLRPRAGQTEPNLSSTPKRVFIVHDSLLELADGTAPDSNLTLRNYELWYQSASSGTTPYYAEASSFLDTTFFCRSVSDPIAWDSVNGTTRLNAVDFGTADTVRDSTIIDLSKTWTVNQWAGFYVHKRMQVQADGSYGYFTNWIRIQGNTATSLILKNTSNNGSTKQYAIVAMPIDEVLGGKRTVTNNGALSSGNRQFNVDTALGTTAYKELLKNPLTVLVTDGQGKGNNRSVRGFGKTSGDSMVMVDGDFLGGGLCGILNVCTTELSRLLFLRSRFPITKFVEQFHERTLWISDTAFQNSFWWSQPSRPGYIEPNDFSVVNPNDGEVIQATWTEDDKVFFGKESKIYALLAPSFETSADDPDNWQIRLVYDKRGVSAPKSVVQRGGNTWFYDWPEGIFEIHDPVNPISNQIRPMIDSITSSARDKVFGVYYPSKKGDFILWGFPVNGSTKCNRFAAYSVATRAWSTWTLDNTDSVRIATALVQEGAGDAGELLLGLADSGYVMRYNPDGNQDTLDGQGTGFTKTFTTVLESKRWGFDNGQMTRFDEIVPAMTTGGSSTITLDFYKDASSTSLSQIVLTSQNGLVFPKKTLADAVLGNRLAWRLSTVSAQSFRLGNIELAVRPYGKRMPE